MKIYQLLFFALLIYTPGMLTAQQGLLGEYYNGTEFQEKITTRIDEKINYVWDGVRPAPGMPDNHYSIRWTGSIEAPASGKFLFSVKADDGIRVWVGGKPMINAWFDNDMGEYSNTIEMEEKHHYDLKIEYYNGILEGEITILWTLPNGNTARPLDVRLLSPLPADSFPVPPPPVAVKKEKPKPPTKPAPPKPKPSATPVIPVPQPPQAVAKKQRELELKFIYFVQSKDIILNSSQKTLDDWVVFLRQQPNVTIVINGHTDDLGNAEKNQALSEKRAALVRDYLVAHGLEPERIMTKGYGSTSPYFKNPRTEQDRKQNRRVEIKVQKQASE